MPTAPKHTPPQAPLSNDLVVNSLVAPSPGVAWGMYSASGFRQFISGFCRTTDNGLTWQTEESTTYGGPFSGNVPVDFSVLDANTAWLLTQTTPGLSPVAEASTLRKTTTGPGTAPTSSAAGRSNFAVVSANMPALFKRIHFFDATTGIAIAAPAAGSPSWRTYRSTDAGATWSAVSAVLPARMTGTTTEELVSKAAIGQHVWVATGTGNVLQTKDGGLTWATVSTGLGTALTGIAFRDATHGLAYGADQQLARSTDGGLTWVAVPNALPNGVTALTTKPGPTGGYLCASAPNGAVASSADDGATWQTLFADNLNYTSLAVGPEGQLWAAVRSSGVAAAFPGLDVLLRYAGSPLATKIEKNPASLAYPNPTAGLVHLAGMAGNAVRVVDATGRQISCRRTDDTLDFSALPAGLYFITLTSPTGRASTQRIALVR